MNGTAVVEKEMLNLIPITVIFQHTCKISLKIELY